MPVEGDEQPRCPCGTILSRYNPDRFKPGAMCAICEQRLVDDRLDRLGSDDPRPPRVKCRIVGCQRWATAKSVETTSHRWRLLCDMHYDAQRQLVSDGMRRRHALNAELGIGHDVCDDPTHDAGRGARAARAPGGLRHARLREPRPSALPVARRAAKRSSDEHGADRMDSGR